MKKFVITTKSESGDDYLYFIEHDEKPTYDEMYDWLKQNGTDIDEMECYESIESIVEIIGFEKLM